MFNEANTVEAFICDLLCGGVSHHTAVGPGLARRTGGVSGLGWHFIAATNLPRRPEDVFVESHLREALERLNPEIAADTERAEDVIHRLRAIVRSVRSDGLVSANEEFAAWLTGERTMPFGEDGDHSPVRFIDFENPEQNQYVVTRQYTFRTSGAGATEKRADVVLLVNGLPLVIVEAKTPVRPSESWFDGAVQIQTDYEANIPEMFVPNVFSVATEGKEFRYGAIGTLLEHWGPWRQEGDEALIPMERFRQSVCSMLQPEVILDLLANFTCYTAGEGNRRAKVIARYQQVDGANRIVERVVASRSKKGLLWHFQGSGKSLLMVFAARKLRMHPSLGNPTVMIVVDRIDLDTQISNTFYTAGVENLVKAESRRELQQMLLQGTRKVIITTIFKFGEAEGVLNDGNNIIALVDEAHRTQEGDLGRKMRNALPNAFLFGLTGTPINRVDRNTFHAFGAEEDRGGYMSRYGFEESMRDGATMPLHFEPRLLKLHMDSEAINEAFEKLTGGLSDLDRDNLARAAARMGTLVKAPKRVEAICADIAQHFQAKVAPCDFGAQVVTFDRESCLLYKRELDRRLPPELSDIVITVNPGEAEFQPYKRDRIAEEKLLDRFRDDSDPLKILIVTSKLLTGFDAPNLQTMYLDKPMRDHTLLQAICRTNRPYGESKTHGLIVDYLGVFDNAAKAIQFDEEGIIRIIGNIAELRDKLPEAMQKCLDYFPGVDRSVEGYEGLIAAQECLPDNDTRDRFAADFSDLSRLWEAVSPDPILNDYESDYRWLCQVYDSVMPSTGTGRLLWHKLGPQTMEIIHRNVSAAPIADNLEAIVLDPGLVEEALDDSKAQRKAKEIEIQVSHRLRRHMNDPQFRALAERLEELKRRHEQGQLLSVAFLEALLELAKDVVSAEKQIAPSADEERGKAALTDLFEEARNQSTPVMVERIVNDIDEIVRQVRFKGWQDTKQGRREVRKALRKELLKYRLHEEHELFGKAYDYIRQYY